MSDKTWYATSIQGSNLIAYYTDPEEAKKHGLRCEEVEIRPVKQEPCPWELSDAKGHSLTNIELLNNEGRKYCPKCGRRL